MTVSAPRFSGITPIKNVISTDGEAFTHRIMRPTTLRDVTYSVAGESSYNDTKRNLQEYATKLQAELAQIDPDFEPRRFQPGEDAFVVKHEGREYLVTGEDATTLKPLFNRVDRFDVLPQLFEGESDYENTRALLDTLKERHFDQGIVVLSNPFGEVEGLTLETLA